MPLYEYHCPACHTRFEQIRSIKHADDLSPCPQCSTASTRQLSCFSVQKSSSTPSNERLTPLMLRKDTTGGCGCCH